MRPRIKEFFDYARKRHEIYLRRQRGEPKPWTKDPILRFNKFTNVFRELDKTTVWFRENVRERYDGKPEVLLATVVFRMFNRIEVGEALFSQININGTTAFEWFAATGDTACLRNAITAYVGKNKPVATGAYIISSPPGYSKLNGILKILDMFNGILVGGVRWCDVAAACTVAPVELRDVFNWLKEVPYFGKFHSYEIVTDLRHTHLLRRAPDVMRWCNVGPGAARGLARIHGRTMTTSGKNAERVTTAQMMQEMGDILRHVPNPKLWPKDWPRWEMRDVEHTLCEFDKYERVRLGQGRPRGVFHG